MSLVALLSELAERLPPWSDALADLTEPDHVVSAEQRLFAQSFAEVPLLELPPPPPQPAASTAATATGRSASRRIMAQACRIEERLVITLSGRSLI
jgi:hypothetical protein